jgi:hypothetical protein
MGFVMGRTSEGAAVAERRRGAAGTHGGPAGTRGGAGRIVAMAIGLAVVLSLALVDSARAGTYEVAQCGWGLGAELDPTAPTEGPGYYLEAGRCLPSGADGGWLHLFAVPEPGGYRGYARARWVAPPGTSFVRFAGTWGGSLETTFRQLVGAEVGGVLRPLLVATGNTEFHPISVDTGGAATAVEVRLDCDASPEAPCRRAESSPVLVRDVTLSLADTAPPTAGLAGQLLTGGWDRGAAMLELSAADVGSGLRSDEATVDDVPLWSGAEACAVATIEGAVRATKLQPCPASAAHSVLVDTTRLTDGTHTLRACAIDFSGTLGCAAAVPLRVDNTAPVVAFDDATEGEVEATVTDPASGPASGQIAVRRVGEDTWTPLEADLRAGGPGTATLRADLPRLSTGAYVFRATALDAAGNSGTGTLRVSGDEGAIRGQVAAAGGARGTAAAHGRGDVPTRLTAYLGTGRKHGKAITVDYGTAATVRGRLLGPGVVAGDRSLAGRRVRVVLLAGRGARPRRVVTHAITDRQGRFTVMVPAGASRHLLVSFGGGGGLAPAPRLRLELRVRAAVTLTATPVKLRTGDRIHLRGRVSPGPARITGGGKLVTIQYFERASGHWRPALVARTDAAGRFDARYRFRYVTGEAHIRLRATALPEADWPYASGSSAPLTVTVDGR